MPVLIANNAVSRLTSALTTSETTLSVTAGDGSKFPSPTGGDWFPLTVLKSSGALEIMRCTARSGDVLTVERGQEGTGAQAFDAGDRVELRATAGVFAESQQRIAEAQSTADAAYRKENILGTVSQSGGVPTGAIIERGSNANGQYIRFADGTQICTKFHIQTLDITANYDSSRMYCSALQTIPYPATFASQPIVHATPVFSLSTPKVTGAVVAGVDPTDWQIQFTALASGTNLSARCMLLSIGRWY